MSDPAALGSGYDLVWAEGSAYSIGFENALALWRTLLRPGGCLVVTELVWFCEHPADRARILQRDSRRFQQRAVFHARRARGFARAAAQAEVDVLAERAVQIDAPVGRSLHELDAPARAVGLRVKHGVAGARGQAKTAVDALVQQASVVRRS